ncbi:hypothetical protein [Acidisoma silvae]|nr:hypothetical protein [Acidisoma silvae]
MIIAALILAYLAMVSKFGYQITLLPSGLMMREQFFNPHKIQKDIPLRSQMLLGGQLTTDVSSPGWATPFSFSFDGGDCLVSIRNFILRMPISRDPRMPVAQNIPIVPKRFKLRPDFTTVFT